MFKNEFIVETPMALTLACACVYIILYFLYLGRPLSGWSLRTRIICAYLDVYSASIFKLICGHISGVNILAIYQQGTTTQLPFYFHQIYFYHIFTSFNKFKDYIRCCTRQMKKVKINKVFGPIKLVYPCHLYWTACTMPRNWAIMYLYDLASLYDFDISF